PPRSTLFPYTTLFRSNVAQGRDAREKAERLRRFHRRRRTTCETEIYVAGPARHSGRIERRAADWCGHGAAARSLRGRAAGGRRDGHAALRQIYRRRIM